MGRNKIILLIGGGLLVFLLVALAFSGHSNTKATDVVSTVTTDKQTGAQYYSGSAKTPETNNGYQPVSIAGASNIIDNITNNQFSAVKQLLSDYVTIHDSDKIRSIKFYKDSVKVNSDKSITATFNTDAGNTTYDLVLKIPDVNSIRVILSNSNTKQQLYDSSYVDANNVTTDPSAGDQ